MYFCVVAGLVGVVAGAAAAADGSEESGRVVSAVAIVCEMETYVER